jgi:D-aspartate ligase
VNRDGSRPSVPALVLGSGLNGLGVARSLGSESVPVYLADTDIRRFELRTRYASRLQLSALEGDSLLRDLVELGQGRFTGCRPVLVLTQERTVRTVAGALEDLHGLFRFVLPSGGLLETLMHKERFARLAEQTGLRIPGTVNVREPGDIETALALTPPLVVKPALHAPQYERLYRKAYLVDDPGQARQLIERILDVLPDVIVQEWIPGNDSDIYFCLQHLSSEGRLECSFVGRKIRSWPPNVGGTASCTSAPEHVVKLTEATASFFKRVGMSGLASMEYKRHAATGEFVAIEPTVGRSDYQEEVATLNGINLPYAYYLGALGRATEFVSGRDRRAIWRDGDADRQSSQTVGQSVQGWPLAHGRVYDALWRSSDPGPSLDRNWRRLAGRIGLCRVAAGVRPTGG